jgi:hypothetical protein
MKKVARIGSETKRGEIEQKMALKSNIKARMGLIQGLIPIGLSAVAEELKYKAEKMAGIKHSQQGGLSGHYRWRSQEGSI